MDRAPTTAAERIVSGIPFLARLSPEDLRSFAGLCRTRRFKKGELVCAQGDPGDAMYVVMDGLIRVSVLSSVGEEATVATIGSGETAGELSLLDGQPRSATMTAEEPSTTLRIGRDAFHAWLLSHPRASIALLETLSLRVRRTDEKFADMVFLELIHRLVKQLLALSDSGGLSMGAGAIRIAVTQAQLAAMLGATRESVNKELNRLARDGLLELGRGSVTILDRSSLQRLV